MTSRFAGVLLDLDGTVYRGVETVPGAARFVERLRAAGVPYLFLTNSASRTPERIAETLREFHGIPCAPSDVMTSALATARALEPGLVHVVGEEGLRRALREAGFQEESRENGVPRYVVVGLDRKIDYRKLDLAARYVRRGALLVATNPDCTVATENGDERIGNGALVAAIEAGSRSRAMVVGKPSRIIFEIALDALGLDAPEKVLMVGDNLRTDIAGGNGAGLRTALLLTGVETAETARAEEMRLEETRTDRRPPDWTLAGYAELEELVFG